MIVYVSIGNSDDKLSQAEWSAYFRSVAEVVRRHASRLHGQWLSLPDEPWQNACICAEFVEDARWPLGLRMSSLRRDLVALIAKYRQGSIAWAVVAETEFIRGGEQP